MKILSNTLTATNTKLTPSTTSYYYNHCSWDVNFSIFLDFSGSGICVHVWQAGGLDLRACWEEVRAIYYSLLVFTHPWACLLTGVIPQKRIAEGRAPL